MIRQRQFIFVRSKRLQLNRERAGEFYREHQGGLFDSFIQHFNCGHGSGTVMAYLIPTNRFVSLYQLDSTETAQREISFFFPEFDMKCQSQYENLSANNLTFNKDTLEHQL